MKTLLVLVVTLGLSTIVVAQTSLDKKPRPAAPGGGGGLQSLRRPAAAASAPTTPAPLTVEQWRAKAVESHPELAQPESALNRAFVAEYKRRRADEPGFFNDSDWPVRLSDEMAAALASGLAPEMAGFGERYRNVSSSLVGLDVSLSPPEDGPVLASLRKAGDGFLAACRAGDPTVAQNAWTSLHAALQTIERTKPIRAMKYNDLAGRDLPVEVSFGLFKDSEDFYVQVGTGNFRTVARIRPAQLLAFADVARKPLDWAAQSSRDALETSKPVGRWDGVAVEFQSTNGGKTSWVWLAVDGSFAADRLIEKDRVRLSLLNYRCLVAAISRAPELLQERAKQSADAATLK